MTTKGKGAPPKPGAASDADFLPDDEPPTPVAAAAEEEPPLEEPPAPVEADPADPQVGIEELQRQLVEERAAREDAERRAAGSAGAADAHEITARNEFLARVDSYGREVSSNVELVKTQLGDTKAKITAAMAEGNFQEAADLQETLAELTSSKKVLESEAMKVERAKKNPPRTERELLNEHVEKVMAPASRDWVKAHPQFMTDANFRARVGSYSDLLLAERGEGFLNTAEYFSEIERRLGLAPAAPARAKRPTASAAAPAPAPRAAAAPARRAATAMPPGNGNGGVVVGKIVNYTADGEPQLTTDQLRVAGALGMSPVRYAEFLEEGAKQNHPALHGRRTN